MVQGDPREDLEGDPRDGKGPTFSGGEPGTETLVVEVGLNRGLTVQLDGWVRCL